MIKKLTILVASCIMTVPIVAAAAPPVKTELTEAQRDAIMEKMANDCEQAYFAFKFGHDQGKLLEQKNNNYPAEYRTAFVLICYGYGKGFEGRRSIA